jgi:hypothetical protein
MQDLGMYDNEKRYIFSNWTNEDFVGMFAGVPTLIKAGEVLEVPQHKAYLFTRHLVNREMMKANKDIELDNPDSRRPFEDKTIAEITAGVDSPAMAILKKKIKDEIEVESGVKVAKKEVAKKSKKEEVKEFEDLN